MRRWLSILVALVVLSVATAGPAAAETVRRTWTAGVGTSGVNGQARLQAFMDGTARLTLAIHGVRASTEYKLEIRAGTCAALGTVVARPFPATSDAAGVIDTYRNLSTVTMNAIWPTARKGAMVIRFVHASGTKCGNFFWARTTRITISALSINLPVIAGTSSYPKCRVAMYLTSLWQPREPGVTFLYAHARTGMFLPLLTRSKINNGASLIGMTVKVYTSDSKVHTYRIDRVRRHVRTLGSVAGITAERLWLQTSEGPNWSYPKLIVEARRVSTAATTYAASHPTARPVSC